MVHPIDIEPSAIDALSVEGPTFGVEPSVIHALSVDGSTPGIRTIRDIGPQRGRFRSERRTFLDAAL